MTPDPLDALAAAVRHDDVAEAGRVLSEHPAIRERLNQPLPGLPFGATALLGAVHRGNREMVDLLLTAGADIDARSGWWAGGFGVLDQDGPLVPYLLERGASVDACAAARHGMLDRLAALVDANPDEVHRRGGDGQTPLHVARTVEVAEYLLDHGADIDALDIDHESTPAQSLIQDRPDVVRYLVSRGARSDILLAAALGDAALVEQHLEPHPASIRTRVSLEDFPKRDERAGGTIYIWTLGWHKTPHAVARLFGHPEVGRLLMERSPDDLKLSVACEMGDEALVEELLALRPGLADELTEAGRRALPHAAQANNLNAIRLMLRAGWPLETPGNDGGTVLHWAAFHGNAEAVREILRHRPDLERRDAVHQGTPLDWAAYGSRHGWHCETGDFSGTVKALLAAGAQVAQGMGADASAEVRELLGR